MNKKVIPLSVPNLKGNELKYVTQAIETEWVSTAGPYINEFESKIADYVGSVGAVSCQNGTSGLHVSLKVLGVNPGDEVIVPTLTFIAAVNPVKYINAEPVFMDCDDSLCMDPYKLREFCVQQCDFINGKLINKKTNRHISALIVVHVFGNIADMEKIMSVAKDYNLKVIEDATESIGSYYISGMYKGKYAGTIGDVGVYSFNGNKIMTTGGGGMIVSNDKLLLSYAKHLTTQAKSDELYFKHDEIGYNYRMTNLQAALGLAQLEQLEEFIDTKTQNYNLYLEHIHQIPSLKLLTYSSKIRSNYWFYALYVEDGFPLNRDDLIGYLSGINIQTRPIWDLISDQKPYLDNQVFHIEKARDYLNHVINIPCSSNLSQSDVMDVIKALKSV